jgi:hypothetical protein
MLECILRVMVLSDGRVRIYAPQVAPELYPYGSRGPVGAHYLAAKYGMRWGDLANEEED